MHFDGSKSKEGVGAGCILIDPKRNKICIRSRLEFDGTNNIVEYEYLIQGLKKEVDLDIKCWFPMVIQKLSSAGYVIQSTVFRNICKITNERYGISFRILKHLMLIPFLDFKTRKLIY